MKNRYDELRNPKAKQPQIIKIEEIQDEEEARKIFLSDEKGNKIPGEIWYEFPLNEEDENSDEFVAYTLDSDPETLLVMKYDQEGNLVPPTDDEMPFIEKIIEQIVKEEEEAEGEE